MRQQVAVVIPVYKPEMNASEQQSFRQCMAVLGHYPIILVKPESLDASAWQAAHPVIQIKNFPDHFFNDIAGYNRLMVSTNFYTSFLEYKYILIYQLDAFVFSDRLREWCQRGFDYIGAPHIDPERWSVGGKDPGNYFQNRRIFLNGGFSLRNVRAFIRFLTIFYFFRQTWFTNEDGLFSLHFIRLRPFGPLLRLPGWPDALDFSLEFHPRLGYELNQNKLPFGCHAWEKYDPDFWKEFINSL
jgi:Protein of unknown function (DUF5672)